MAEQQGWVKIHRKMLNSPIWNVEGEKKCKAAAWIELILLAGHNDRDIFTKDNRSMHLKRGQLHTSIEKLASRWLWNRKTVSAYLDMLEEAGMITQERTSRGTTITIVNYNVYQGFEGDDWTAERTAEHPSLGQRLDSRTDSDGTAVRTQSRMYKNYKELKELKEGEEDEETPSSLSNPDLKKAIQAYEETGRQISTTTASDFADLIGRYGADWVVEAIRTANRAGRDHVRVNYITGILRNWEERGGIDDGRSGKHSEHAEAEERINRQLAGDIF